MQGSDHIALSGPKRNRFRFGVKPLERYAVACFAAAFTVLGILFVNPPSLAHFAYYLCLWGAFVFVFHREDIEDFTFAYLVNSAYIAAFFFVQTQMYPDSYGTTSPRGSWTDDSYFYALVADNIPANLLTRDYFYLYSHPFTDLIRSLTILSIDHPMDVIFFQSGVAATLVTFSRRFMLQLSSSTKLADTVYVFALVCPFLMMNGGVIFIRDTFAAALFVYSLCCLNSKRFLLALAAVVLQVALRPGTALILFPAYVIIYFGSIKAFLAKHPALASAGALLLAIAAMGAIQLTPDLSELVAGTSDGGGIGFLGRDIINDLTADPEGNVAFLSIQELPFLIKLFLNGAYIFLYPFLSSKYAFAGDHYDVRAITMNLIVPVYSLWLNAWFIAGAFSKIRVAKHQTAIMVAIAVSFLLIGTYSLQSRHKTILYPLYYFVIAIGFTSATLRERHIGYWCSSALLLLQLSFALR